MRLKKLEDQVMVITGASSGIGLCTARMAARRGARVVLCARDEQALREAVDGIRSEGGAATYLVADVSDETALRRVAEHAVATYGTIDTWVNNAGVSVYGRAEEIELADMHRLFDVNFWGVVHGCRVALPYLQVGGGVLINVGSVESELALPMNSVYAASKHAVKGFTDALRLELEKQKSLVSVTLIKPSAIDTPFFEHAKNYMEGDPNPPPPVYAPEVVARAILRSAEHRVRDIVVGGAGRAQVGMSRVAPRLSDRLGEATLFEAQQREPRVGRSREGNLYRTGRGNGRVRGDYGGHVMRSSAYTTLSLHPLSTALAALGVGTAIWGLVSAMRTQAGGRYPRRPSRAWQKRSRPSQPAAVY